MPVPLCRDDKPLFWADIVTKASPAGGTITTTWETQNRISLLPPATHPVPGHAHLHPQPKSASDHVNEMPSLLGSDPATVSMRVKEHLTHKP